MPSRHRVIAHLIQRGIARGEFSAGANLPPTAELARRFGPSSPEEVRLALARLQSDGVIVIRDDLTAVVRHSPTLTHLMSTSAAVHKALPTHQEGFDAEAIRAGVTSSHRAETTTRPSPVEVADQLEIGAGAPVVHRRTVRFANDEPSALEDFYCPYDVVAHTDRTAARDLETVIDAAGWLRVGWVDTVAARLANREEALHLALEPGAPILDHARVLYAMNGERVRPVTYVRTLSAGNRTRLTYEHKQSDAPSWPAE